MKIKRKLTVHLKTHKLIYFLGLFTIIAVILRFYNLTWGAPFYFHPDERQNIAYPILDSKHPLMYDQKNFDINPLPLIVIKNTYLAVSLIPITPKPDPTAVIIIISRLISASLSVTISLLLFHVASVFFSKKIGIVTFLLSIFSTGLIQYAHFGTVELWEAFLLLLLLYSILLMIYTKSFSSSVITGVLFSLALATKFLTVFFIPPVILGIGIFTILIFREKRILRDRIQIITLFYLQMLISALITTLIFFPQILIDPFKIKDSLTFESSVATGALHVFFTEGFTNTVPFFFQFLKVFPFILNPILTALLPASLLLLLVLGVKEKNYKYLVVFISFVCLFLFQAILYVKWTRYMIPTLPFAYIALAICIVWFEDKTKALLGIKLPLTSIGIILVSILFSLSFFFTVYMHKHSTIQALEVMKNYFPKEERGIGEPFDLNVTPFHAYYNNIFLFNFYDLDSGNSALQNLETELSNSSFVLLSSQRILRSRISNPSHFPIGNSFYNSLFQSRKYTLLYRTPCNFICKIAYLGDPDLGLEETATVFDRPSIFLFKINNEKKTNN